MEAEQMQDCRVEVVGVDRVYDRFKPDLVSCTVSVPGPDARPGKEGRERPVVVLAPLVIG